MFILIISIDRIKVFVITKSIDENKNDLIELKKVFNYFQLEKNVDLVPIEINDIDVSSLENSFLNINDEFRVKPDEQLTQKNIVDLSKVINKLSLKFYDTNLKYVNCKLFIPKKFQIYLIFHKSYHF